MSKAPNILTPREPLTDSSGTVTSLWWRFFNSLNGLAGSTLNPLTVKGSAILNAGTLTQGGTISSPDLAPGTLIGNAETVAGAPAVVTVGAGLTVTGGTLSVDTLPPGTLAGNPGRTAAPPTEIVLGTNLTLFGNTLNAAENGATNPDDETLLYSIRDTRGPVATLARGVSDDATLASLRPNRGTVYTILTGTGLTGGPIYDVGTISFAPIASLDLLANITGGSAAPIPNTLTAVIDAAIGNIQGDVLYRSATAWTVLPPGTSGQALVTGGGSANPSWAVPTLGTIANLDVLANISGGVAVPIANTLTAVIDAAIGSTQGDILYRSASAWTILAPGTAGNVLATGGASANPSWAAPGGVGTVTSVGTGTGLTGGPITGSGTVSLATIAADTLLANATSGTAAPVATTVTALIDAAIGNVQGDILYRSGSAWVVLAPGTLGNVLTTGGPAANPAWSAAGTGTVTSVATGTGLTGGPVTTTGTVSLAAIASNNLLANATGGSAAPVATTVTALIDAALGSAQGDLLYRGASAWLVLAPGTIGQFLQTGGASAVPAWTTVSDVGRNLFDNSMDRVQQRGSGPFTTAGLYTSDRWVLSFQGGTNSVTIVALTDADRAAIGDQAAQYGLQNVFTGGAGATDVAFVECRTEGVHATANKTVTVSFWAKAASGTPKLGIINIQVFGTGGSPTAPVVSPVQNVSLTTSFVRYTLTFVVPSIAGKTFGSTAGTDSFYVRFYYSGGASAGTGTGVQSGTITLFGRQLEIGAVPTPLEKPDLATELVRCQRFYQIGQLIGESYQAAGNAIFFSSNLPVTMRASPTVAAIAVTFSNCTGLTQGAYINYTVWISAVVTALGPWLLVASFTASADL